jgi:Domain of unknown function (DUF397)
LHVAPECANVGLGGAFGIAAKDGMATVSLTTAIRDVTSGSGVVLVLDTKDRDGGTLAFSAGAWERFTASLLA